MDSILLIPPGASNTACSLASAIQLGSWLQADPGPDFGTHDLIHTLESSNALTDGGVFTARFAPPRKMSFPLLVNPLGSQGASNMLMWEAKIRLAAMPGAMLAVQPEGVATSEAVFFDVLDGRWEPDYNVFHNRAARRKGLLHVDTQPWGYWPTEILLASAASVGFIGNLAVNGASVIGDVPPLAHIIISPTVASGYAVAQYPVDMVAWSLGGRPSFNPFISPSSIASIGNIPAAGLNAPTWTFDKYAPQSSAAVLFPYIATSGAIIPQWVRFDTATAGISSALEPAYRGRFRVYAFAKLTNASGTPWQILVDADRYTNQLFPNMASSNQIATVVSNLPSTRVGGADQGASPGYGIYDMGEITLPPVGSGFQQGDRLRLWIYNSATIPVGATVGFFFGGFWLQPVDGAAGILPRGLVTPTLTGGTQGALEMNGRFVDSILLAQQGGSAIISDARALYRGVTPRIGASTSQLTFLTADRVLNGYASQFQLNQNVEYSFASVSYRPQFQFLHGI